MTGQITSRVLYPINDDLKVAAAVVVAIPIDESDDIRFKRNAFASRSGFPTLGKVGEKWGTGANWGTGDYFSG